MTYVASIVVPLLRQSDDWLEQSVRSGLDQTVPTEVVVVRSDRTPPSNLAVLRRLQTQHAGLAVVVEEKPGNFPNAVNTGIRCARADRVGLLMSDDWLHARAVAFSAGLDADIVSTGHVVHFADGRINEPASRTRSPARYRSLATPEAKASYLKHFFLIRRELALQAGLDETIGNFPGIDDYDFIWTLLERGASVALVEEPLYHYRDHDGERLSLTARDLQIANLEKILRKHNVRGQQAHDVIASHSKWYGHPIHRVLGGGQQRGIGALSRVKTALRSGLRMLAALRRAGPTKCLF